MDKDLKEILELAGVPTIKESSSNDKAVLTEDVSDDALKSANSGDTDLGAESIAAALINEEEPDECDEECDELEESNLSDKDEKYDASEDKFKDVSYRDEELEEGEGCSDEEMEEDCNEELEEEVCGDFQNGYDKKHEDRKYYSDRFPSGATSPVSNKAGPASAKHGDNPLQKKGKTSVTEAQTIHKELVYSYRRFLKE